METLESSRVCRLCGKQSGISIDIFDRGENHVRKINAVLPIMVHEMDLLPKHMCHRCSYKLEEFHKFYVDCLKTDADLKSQLSWMRKEESQEKIGVPMVHIENVKIKVEPPDYDIYELDPIVENVNYINSMSSVTFPVINRVQTSGIHEGITYAAYARCGCCCDKKDQSKRAVSSMGYEGAVSRSDRVNDVDARGGASNLQAVKKDPLDDDAFQPHNRSTGDAQTYRSSVGTKGSSSAVGMANVIGGAKVKSPRNGEFLSRSTIVRNLRPRNALVDYVGPKRTWIRTVKSNLESESKGAGINASASTQPKFEMPKIKVEKMDEFEGRILRPRKRTIDYIGPKRKYSRSMDKGQQKLADGYHASRHKVMKIANESKLLRAEAAKFLPKDEMRLSIKQELLSDLEDAMLDESMSATSRVPKGRVASNVGGLSKDVDALSNKLLGRVQNDTVDYGTSNSAQSRSNFPVASKLRPLKSITKSKLKPEKLGANRFTAITYSPKYLRSQDLHLRNGKIKTLDGAEKSMKKMRKDTRRIGERGRTVGKNLMGVINGTVNAKNVPEAIKLLDNIKHYCEKCNVSFANKELYKLHACYD